MKLNEFLAGNWTTSRVIRIQLCAGQQDENIELKLQLGAIQIASDAHFMESDT